jgi:hypothetical protein
MSLNTAQLEADLRELFSGAGGFPASRDEAGTRWSQIYRSYCEGATSCQAGNPIPAALDAAEPILAGALAVAFSASDPASCANGIAAALTGFWFLPPVTFSNAGVVTVVGGTAVLAAAILANGAANIAAGISAQDAAAQFAGLLSAFTVTVIVSHPGLPCAAPIF